MDTACCKWSFLSVFSALENVCLQRSQLTGSIKEKVVVGAYQTLRTCLLHNTVLYLHYMTVCFVCRGRIICEDSELQMERVRAENGVDVSVPLSDLWARNTKLFCTPYFKYLLYIYWIVDIVHQNKLYYWYWIFIRKFIFNTTKIQFHQNMKLINNFQNIGKL